MTPASPSPTLASAGATHSGGGCEWVRGLTRRWRMPAEPADPTLPGGFMGSALPAVVQRVMHARGFADAAAVAEFCEPRLSHLCDPALLPNIDAAAHRLIDALRRNEMIVIYGDYDVDGVTATAILYHTIKTVQPAARLRTYVPHRLEEGYGLNCDALRQLKAEGADLVITVDCGITALKSAHTAHEIGLDLIITDHHEFTHRSCVANSMDLPRDGNPKIIAVHPGLPGSAYPFADLCGVGVAFKLAWHFAKLWCNSDRVSKTLQDTLVNMLPLVALGTIADVVPLLGENRVMTAFGLRLIKQSPLPGLRALIEASGLMDEKIDSERVGFSLAPRLNACGRMGHAAEAVHMLTDATPAEAVAIAQQLNEHNIHRQGVERRIFEHAARLAEDSGMTSDAHRAIVLAHESWHPGVVGIVCSRMVERFGRPVVLLQHAAPLCKGSARSIDGYSIHDGLASASTHLATFGGHAMAAGLSLSADNLAAFTDALVGHANANITIDQLTPCISIDCQAMLAELDDRAVHGLQSLSPFGRGNRAPTLLVRDVTLAEAPKQMGSNGKHLALRLRQEHAGARNLMRAVWWSAGERAADLAAGMRLDVAIEPKLNTWNGRVSVEAQVRDLRILRPAQA